MSEKAREKAYGIQEQKRPKGYKDMVVPSQQTTEIVTERLTEGRLVIHKIKGINISDKEIKKVWCQVWLDKKDPSKVRSTTPQKKTAAPQWIEDPEIQFAIKNHKTLKIRVYKDAPEPKCFLGKINLELHRAYCKPGKKLLFEETLKNSKKKKREKLQIKGKVGISLTWPRPWQSLKAMNRKRMNHTATLLHNGNVLVCGGIPQPHLEGLQFAEIFDSKKEEFKEEQLMMRKPRACHSATRLIDGRVLIAAGFNKFNEAESHCEIYDPWRNNFQDVQSMREPRYSHSATLLKDGRVLVAGGVQKMHGIVSCEIFDPKTNSWSPAASLPAGIFGHIGHDLPDGRVWVVGGASTKNPGESTMYSFMYDPAANKWANGPPLPYPLLHHAVYNLKNGKVLIMPGTDWYASETANRNQNFYYTCHTVNVANKEVKSLGRLKASAGTFVHFKGDVVVSIGGKMPKEGFVKHSHILNVAENSDFDATWDKIEEPTCLRVDAVATKLPGGTRVLFSGGLNPNCRAALEVAELFNVNFTSYGLKHPVEEEPLEKEPDPLGKKVALPKPQPKAPTDTLVSEDQLVAIEKAHAVVEDVVVEISGSSEDDEPEKPEPKDEQEAVEPADEDDQDQDQGSPPQPKSLANGDEDDEDDNEEMPPEPKGIRIDKQAQAMEDEGFVEVSDEADEENKSEKASNEDADEASPPSTSTSTAPTGGGKKDALGEWEDLLEHLEDQLHAQRANAPRTT